MDREDLWAHEELDMTKATEHACIFLESLPPSDLSRKNTTFFKNEEELI